MGIFTGYRFENLEAPREGRMAERKGFKDKEPKEAKAGAKEGMDKAPEGKGGKKHGGKRHHSRHSSR